MPDSSSPLALANLFGLDGKVAVVTGGSRGIGFMIASGLVANGVKVYITARKAEQCDAAGFDKVMAINVKAPFMLTQALLPQLRAGATADDPARVIMIGSIDGIRVPIGDNYSYSASKAGIHMMARHMAAHLVKDDITINSIAPGPFESKMMAYRLEDPDSRKMVEASVPRTRIGSPQDVAGAVIFLASRAGAYTTGAVVPVDGGISTL